ncbi:hypothetical protein HNY73_004806 [Argiope bruennichi]|uniref:Uncharacterized protein n=1 Tax=Argiope bruennichi TaxID=94029 RepID=A0A8T0FQC1_ARGBR|nr:hypothetical protein HNY73_004806 [Argiope bruennichi]
MRSLRLASKFSISKIGHFGFLSQKVHGFCFKDKESNRASEVMNLAGVCPLAPWTERKPATLSPRPSQQVRAEPGAIFAVPSAFSPSRIILGGKKDEF